MALKLNLGCGSNHRDGYVNVDKEPACHPDRVVDLEAVPWPFDDDSVEEVLLHHVLEHIGRESAVYLAMIRELWRVCRDGAVVRIAVPHPRHDSFLNDPTHVRPVTPAGLEHFSRARNREWAERGLANTPLADYLGVDFEIRRVDMVLDEPWLSGMQQGKLTRDQLTQAVRLHNNVVREINIEWLVRK